MFTITIKILFQAINNMLTRKKEITVKALIFFRLLLSNSLNWKFTAIIILHFHLNQQFKYELFHIYYTSKWKS